MKCKITKTTIYPQILQLKINDDVEKYLKQNPDLVEFFGPNLENTQMVVDEIIDYQTKEKLENLGVKV